MELKQRKKIANRLPKFDPGNDGNDTWSQYGGWEQPPLWGNYGNTNNNEYWPKLVRPLTVPNRPSSITLQDYIESRIPKVSDIPAGFGVQQQDPQQEQQEGEQQGGKSGGGVNPNGIVAGATNLIGGILSQQSSVKGRDELLADAGRSNQSVMGINYQSQNNVDSAAERRSLDNAGLKNTVGTTAAGAMLGGSIVPGIGHAVGAAAGAVAGLVSWGFSKHKLKKRIANAQHLAMRRNTANQAGAMTSALTQNYYQENGNTAGGILYANRGKDLRQPKYEK